MSAQLFAAIAALAREEHAIVVDERYEELEGVRLRRDVLMAALPPVPPAWAMDDLREAARLQGLITAALREARDATGAQLRRLGTARTGAQGYAAGTGVPSAPRSAYSRLG
ncbi:MAG: hypothetical protein QOK49_4807 [Baekduia sp.]|jgi:hypothetical protein|nr:hypothetical protein [Baekduia sp.]MDX6730002.1 hypothetical protein [Baekduia sp.]